MQIGPFTISISRGTKAGSAFTTSLPAPLPATARNPPGADGWHRLIETYPGQWQAGIVQPDPTDQLLRFGAVFAATTMIASDIAKMRPTLELRMPDGTWQEAGESMPAAELLRRPNRYSTWSAFLERWMYCRLLHGNVYCAKEVDEAGRTMGLHLLNPSTTKVIVSADGGCYYGLHTDPLAQVDAPVIVRASALVHDRQHTLFHPLVGQSTISAAAAAGTFGAKIQAQSTQFFTNMSRPSGQLTTDQELGDETAERLKADFERGFAGGFIGRLLVSGSGLKYEPLSVPAHDAQLIEQLQWTGADVARVFGIPAYRLGIGDLPSYQNISQLTLDYYSRCLLTPITAIELALAEALELPTRMRVRLDTSALLRMDPLTRADAAAKLVGAGILAPNEARRNENLGPVDGGDVPFMQQQMWQIGQLAGRSAPTDAAGTKELRRELDSLAAVLRGVQARLDRRAPD